VRGVASSVVPGKVPDKAGAYVQAVLQGAAVGVTVQEALLALDGGCAAGVQEKVQGEMCRVASDVFGAIAFDVCRQGEACVWQQGSDGTLYRVPTHGFS
jgi:hypothetical protein